jgi:hypothetical protein
MQTELDTPHLFMPDRVPVVSQLESYQLQGTEGAGTPALEGLVSPHNASACNGGRFLVARGSYFEKFTTENALAQDCS